MKKIDNIPNTALIHSKTAFRLAFSYILSLPKKNLYIIDPYFDTQIFLKIRSNVASNISINIYTKDKKQFDHVYVKNNFQNIDIKLFDKRSQYQFHDRFIIIDNKYYFHFGHSLNGIFKSEISLFSRVNDSVVKNELKKIICHIFNT